MSNLAGTLCIYCGLAQANTADHVPPKCLFTEPRPPNLYTVPSCSICNEGFSRDDEYFRTAMAFRWDVSDHPAASTIIAKALRSTAQSRGFRRLFTRTLEEAPIVTHSGLYVEDGARFEADMPRINRVLERVVRGLYFKKIGTPLPLSHRVFTMADEMLEQTNNRLRTDILRAWAPHTQQEPEVFGNEAFLFFWRADTATNQSCWLLVFFSRVIFYGITIPPGSSPLLSSPSPDPTAIKRPLIP